MASVRELPDASVRPVSVFVSVVRVILDVSACGRAPAFGEPADQLVEPYH
jgi:hypothetical protein